MVKESKPIVITDDPRLGRLARTKNGFEGVVDRIWRFSDGKDVVHLYSEEVGLGNGGLYWEEITFLDGEE